MKSRTYYSEVFGQVSLTEWDDGAVTIVRRVEDGIDSTWTRIHLVPVSRASFCKDGESTLAYTGGTWKTDCKPKKGKK